MDWEAVVGIISVCVTAMGWGVVYYLARIREDRSRQIERQLERCDRQIEEFYGPLYNLMQQIENTFYVNDEILKMSGLSPEEREGRGIYQRALLLPLARRGCEGFEDPYAPSSRGSVVPMEISQARYTRTHKTRIGCPRRCSSPD